MIKSQIEKVFGHGISPSSVAGVDYQFACFEIAKKQGKKPLDVATQMAKSHKGDLATACASAPGFINFVLTDKALQEIADYVLKNNKIPLETQEKRKIFFDYGGANVAKELHIGHLRPPIIGEALKRVFQAFGHKTIADTYLGDWGLQMGLVIAELELNGNPEITIELLNEYYPIASKRAKEDENFRKKAEEYTARLQNLEEPYYSVWKKMRAVSVEKIRENYNRLNCTFDLYNGESTAQPFVEKVLEVLKPHTRVDNDCVLMDVKDDSDNKPMPPVILKKGNGGDLYATSDVATLYYRQKSLKPDEYVYVTDFRQNLHFEQVFRVAKKGGIIPSDVMLTHIGLGTITGADGKPFKTRDGGTIRLEDVINLVVDAAKDERVGLSALKFADLVNHVKSGYIFDVDKFISFEGKTGPYILYTIARINSILEKSDKWTGVTSGLNHEVMGAIVKLSDAYTAATQNYTLNGIVDAMFLVAQAFNVFYGKEQIIGNDANLTLAKIVKLVLEFVMDTLAIDVVEKMTRD